MNVPAATDTVQLIPLDQVVVPPDRLREVDPARAAAMAVSMAERGQITPIEVGPVDPDGYHVLNIGAHRLTAARLAGLPTIKAIVFEGNADERRLREIDENLYRAELSPFDQAAFLAERLDVFQRINGKLAKGRPSKSGASSHRFLFYQEVQDRFGLSTDVVKKALARFEGMTNDARARLRARAGALSGADLDRLRRLSDHDREEALRRLLREVAPVASLSAALREMRAGEDPEPAEHVHFQRLLSTWNRADEGSRQRFLAFLVREKLVRPAR